MIPLRLPASHPDSSVMQNWARDKEKIIDGHGTRLKQIEGILKTILTNSPDLGKAK